MCKSANKKGFSIIEAVIAVAILTIGLFAVSQLFPFGLKIVGDSQKQTTATNIALSKIEELRTYDYSALTAGILEAKQRVSDEPGSYLYAYQRETSVQLIDADFNESSSDEGLKKITVTVYWPSTIGQREKSIQIATLASNY